MVNLNEVTLEPRTAGSPTSVPASTAAAGQSDPPGFDVDICEAGTTPREPFTRLDIDLGTPDSGVGVAMNNLGQYVVAGAKGAVVGKGTQFEALPVHLGTNISGVGVAINAAGQYVIAGTHGAVIGRGRRYVELPVAGGSHWSGVGAAINSHGQYIIAGSGRPVIGRGKDYEEIRIDLGSARSGVSVGINDVGQYILAGSAGLYVGQGDTHPQELDVLLLTSTEAGLGAAINAAGQYVVAGYHGVVIGKGMQCEKLPLRVGEFNAMLGASINSDGYYLVAGPHRIALGRGADFVVLDVELGTDRSGVGASIDDSGRFMIAGTRVYTGDAATALCAKRTLVNEEIDRLTRRITEVEAQARALVEPAWWQFWLTSRSDLASARSVLESQRGARRDELVIIDRLEAGLQRSRPLARVTTASALNPPQR